MPFEFEYVGGSIKPTSHTIEKFILFFVVGGQEVSFYQMSKDSLVLRITEAEHRYTTGNNVLKIFLGQSGFGIPRRYHSFYLKLVDKPAPIVTVYPFSGHIGFYLKGKFNFLKKKQIMQILDESCPSKGFMERQEPLALDVLQRLISVDKTEMKKGIRHVRIGKEREDYHRNF